MQSSNGADPGEIKVIQEGQPGAEEAPIRFCQDHWDRLVSLVQDEKKVMAGFDTLTRLSLRTIGAVDVCKFGCPVCALNQFDYIQAIASVLTIDREESRIMVL